MNSPHFTASISEKSIASVESKLEPSTKHGADIRFHGVVRDSENEQEISGIDYSFYKEMALAELEKIGIAIGEEFPDHIALVHHKVGYVAAGEASILIRVQTAHSKEGFAISQEYLRRIKETVPIWQKCIFAREE